MFDMEFRYQIIVSAISFTKFMIPIVLFKKFPCLMFITSVEVCNKARCSSKIDELRNIVSIGYRPKNITILNEKLTISKSNSSCPS